MGKDIYVFAEQRNSELMPVSLELTSKARKLADRTYGEVVAVLLGWEINHLSEKLIEYGADRVIVVEDKLLKYYITETYAKAFTHIIADKKPEIVLIGATSIGRDLAPRISARIQTGLTADCTALEIDEETGLLLMTRPAFGGNIMATIVCENYRPQMATVRPGVMKACKIEGHTGKVEQENIEFTVHDMNVVIKDIIKRKKDDVDITKAKVIISGGRGVGSKENFKLLEKLAEKLGGEVAASRFCVEQGWIDKERQVGQTGKSVRPELYLACGISGAIQHLAGMESSKLIIAINKDENAQIFKYADLGIVGDLHKILPELIEIL